MTTPMSRERLSRNKPHTIESLLALTEPITESGCWIFHGPLSEMGYARITINYKPIRVHRLMYEHFIGAIPEGLVPDHLCRVRCCVNPWHIEPVTSRINTLRGDGPSARQAQQTHCKRGHEFIPENTYVKRDGARNCRICLRELWKSYRKRRLNR